MNINIRVTEMANSWSSELLTADLDFGHRTLDKDLDGQEVKSR
jgi:hypothetical protein